MNTIRFPAFVGLLFSLGVLFYPVYPGRCQDRTLLLVVDSRSWYPFTFASNSHPSGIHVDLVSQAMHNLEIPFKIKSYPRRRAILQVQKGRADAMISIAYSPALAKYLEFPTDASSCKESSYRIGQVDFVVLTWDKKFHFQGKFNALPEPVRIPLGDELESCLKPHRLILDFGRTDVINMCKMVRDRDGTVITTSILAEKFLQDKRFKGKFIIQPIPLLSKSYFLAFSKRTSLKSKVRERIWEEIKRLREDYIYTLQLYARY